MDETQVRFAFAPNGWTSPGCGSIADYYPGDEFVDVNAFSGYNFGAENTAACVDGAFGWETPYQVLIGPTEALRAIAPLKPIIVAQTAAPRTGCGATTANGGQDKWARDLFEFAAADSNIVGIIWLNSNNGPNGPGPEYSETDWRIWDGTNATQGWKDAMNLNSGGLATRYAWPLTDWFLPGPLVVDAPPGPCPVGSICDTAAFVNVPGKWYRYSALGAGDPITAFYFGNPGDVPLMGDWNCDGVKTPACTASRTASSICVTAIPKGSRHLFLLWQPRRPAGGWRLRWRRL